MLIRLPSKQTYDISQSRSAESERIGGFYDAWRKFCFFAGLGTFVLILIFGFVVGGTDPRMTQILPTGFIVGVIIFTSIALTIGVSIGFVLLAVVYLFAPNKVWFFRLCSA
jgi:hypothetical protein